MFYTIKWDVTCLDFILYDVIIVILSNNAKVRGKCGYKPGRRLGEHLGNPQIYMYMYIYREREREKERYVNMYKKLEYIIFTILCNATTLV